jgi:excisionase family DNA binding protein
MIYMPESLAARWMVGERTVRRRCESGELNAFRVGKLWRIPEDAVAEYETHHANRQPEPIAAPPVAPRQRVTVSAPPCQYTPIVKGVVPWQAEVIE